MPDPRATNESSQMTSSQAAASNANTSKVLVVDDNDGLRYTVTRSLREAGYEVVEARNGAEALALASQLPDLITLDVNLPDVSGFEICRQLKSNPETGHIPVLQLSASFVDADSRDHKRKHQPIRDSSTAQIRERRNREDNQSRPPGDRIHTQSLSPLLPGRTHENAIRHPNRRPH